MLLINPPDPPPPPPPPFPFQCPVGNSHFPYSTNTKKE